MTELLGSQLSDEQIKTFTALTSGQYENFLLMSVLFQGEETAAICALTVLHDAASKVTPLYLAVTPKMAMSIQDPYGEVPAK